MLQSSSLLLGMTNNKNLENINTDELARSIATIGEKCSLFSVSDIVVA